MNDVALANLIFFQVVTNLLELIAQFLQDSVASAYCQGVLLIEWIH